MNRDKPIPIKPPTKEELDKRFRQYLEFLSQNRNLFAKPQKPTDYRLFKNMKL